MATCDPQALIDPCLAAMNDLDLTMFQIGVLLSIQQKLDGDTPLDCSDPQEIITATECYRSLYPAQTEVIKAQILQDILGLLSVPAIEGCLASLSSFNLQLVITQQLCNIIDKIENEGEVTCDIQELLDQASCFAGLSLRALSEVQASQICTLNDIIEPPINPPSCTLAIGLQPESFTGEEGDNVALSASVTGNIGIPTYQWYKDGVPVVDGGFQTGAQTLALHMEWITPEQSGDYYMIATDPAVPGCTAQTNTVTVTISAEGNNLLTDLAAFWTFDEPSGNALDSSGNGYTLTENGSLPSTTGIVEGSRHYDANDANYFSRASAPAFIFNGPFTITAWCRFDPLPFATNDMTIMSKTTGFIGGVSWWLGMDHGTPNDAIWFYHSADAGVNLEITIFDLGGPVQAGWYFVVVRSDGSTVEVSATHESETDLATPEDGPFVGCTNTPAVPLTVGHYLGDSLHNMRGEIDEVGIWNKELSDCELSWLFRAKEGIFSYNLFDGNSCS